MITYKEKICDLLAIPLELTDEEIYKRIIQVIDVMNGEIINLNEEILKKKKKILIFQNRWRF